jgi:hypothetical protein
VTAPNICSPNRHQTTRSGNHNLLKIKVNEMNKLEYDKRNYLATHSQSETLLLPGKTTDYGNRSDAQMLAEFDALFFD